MGLVNNMAGVRSNSEQSITSTLSGDWEEKQASGLHDLSVVCVKAFVMVESLFL